MNAQPSQGTVFFLLFLHDHLSSLPPSSHGAITVCFSTDHTNQAAINDILEGDTGIEEIEAIFELDAEQQRCEHDTFRTRAVADLMSTADRDAVEQAIPQRLTFEQVAIQTSDPPGPPRPSLRPSFVHCQEAYYTLLSWHTSLVTVLVPPHSPTTSLWSYGRLCCPGGTCGGAR